MKKLAVASFLALAVALLPVAANAYYLYGSTPSSSTVTTPYYCGTFYSSYPCDYSNTNTNNTYTYGIGQNGLPYYYSYPTAPTYPAQYPYSNSYGYDSYQYGYNYNTNYQYTGGANYTTPYNYNYNQYGNNSYYNTNKTCYQGVLNGPTYYYPCNSNPWSANGYSTTQYPYGGYTY
jgi:hypothetical protein